MTQSEPKIDNIQVITIFHEAGNEDEIIQTDDSEVKENIGESEDSIIPETIKVIIKDVNDPNEQIDKMDK